MPAFILSQTCLQHNVAVRGSGEVSDKSKMFIHVTSFTRGGSRLSASFVVTKKKIQFQPLQHSMCICLHAVHTSYNSVKMTLEAVGDEFKGAVCKKKKCIKTLYTPFPLAADGRQTVLLLLDFELMEAPLNVSQQMGCCSDEGRDDCSVCESHHIYAKSHKEHAQQAEAPLE